MPLNRLDTSSDNADPKIPKASMNVLALVKEQGERYVYLYDDDSASELLQVIGRHAADTELSFSWYDAAVLSQKVRRLQREQESAKKNDDEDRA